LTLRGRAEQDRVGAALLASAAHPAVAPRAARDPRGSDG
jgi:hypothetical protein